MTCDKRPAAAQAEIIRSTVKIVMEICLDGGNCQGIALHTWPYQRAKIIEWLQSKITSIGGGVCI